MASGDVTLSIVGVYDTLALAVAAGTGVNLAAVTDRVEIINTGTHSFALVKYVRA